MAQAVVTTAFGGPENLHLDDLVLPAPGAGQVAIAVRAAGVNPADVKLRSGTFGTDQSWLPMRLGSEASGAVTAVGDDVTSVGVGKTKITVQDAIGNLFNVAVTVQ